MVGVPTISRINDKTRCRCKICSTQLRPGDIVINYVSSVYGSSVHTAFIHLSCLLNTAPKECEFEVLLQAMIK